MTSSNPSKTCKRVIGGLALSLTLMADGAAAQTTFVSPNGSGGYVAVTPGQPSTFINSNGLGGYTVVTPGAPTAFINSNGLGGYTINQAAPPPSYERSFTDRHPWFRGPND